MTRRLQIRWMVGERIAGPERMIWARCSKRGGGWELSQSCR